MPAPQSSLLFRIVSRLVFYVGLFCMAAAVYLAYGPYTSPRTGRVEGNVVVAGTQPIVQFTAPNGNVVRFYNVAETRALKAGDHIAVAFDPRDPTAAGIVDFWGDYLKSMLLGGVGLVFLIAGFMLRVFMRKSRR